MSIWLDTTEGFGEGRLCSPDAVVVDHIGHFEVHMWDVEKVLRVTGIKGMAKIRMRN